jgi:AcrR family transcriptional regulator
MANRNDPHSTASPAKRADARENRTRILTAAAEVFAAEGLSAPLDLIRERAGVGRATLYRNFADRRALIIALIDGVLIELAAIAQEVHDSDDAVFTLFAHMIDRLAGNVAVVEYWRTADPGDPAVLESRAALHALLAGPFDRAHKAGLIAADLEPEDLFIAFRMIAATLQGRDVAKRRAAGRRALRIVMHGLAPPEQPQST